VESLEVEAGKASAKDRLNKSVAWVNGDATAATKTQRRQNSVKSGEYEYNNALKLI